MEQAVCSRCHMPANALNDVPAEISVYLKKNMSRDFIHKRVCVPCFQAFEQAVQDPIHIPNRVTPEVLRKVEAWSRRTDVLKEAAFLMKSHKNEEAKQKYDEYVNLIEEGFSMPMAQFTAQVFRESGRREELAVFVLVLWDLIVLNEGNDEKQKLIGAKIIELSRGLPMVATLQARVRKYERTTKNKLLFKQMFKDLGGKGCFVASYVFADPYAPEVMVLRQFRDQYLMPHFFSRRWVKLYYEKSPAWVMALENSKWGPVFKPVVKSILRILAFLISPCLRR